MMRKMIALVCALGLAVSAAGCSGSPAAAGSAPASSSQVPSESASEAVSSAPSAAASSEASLPAEVANVPAPADFPKKDIKFIVPFAAGGGTDTMARMVASAAGKDYFNGHSLIVENMGGGGAVIGQTYVAKTAPADGYTVMVYTSSVINNALLKDVTYSYEDFKPIIGCNPDAEIIAVPTNSPYKTLKDLIEAARTTTIKVATPGHSSGHHIRALNMARLMGLNFEYIHNDSAAMQLSQLMGGHCDVAFMTVSEAAGTILDGQAVGLGVMAVERDPALPDVPTFMEEGYEGWVDGANRGIACSKDVPDDIYQYLVSEFHKICTSDAYVDAMTKSGITPGAETPEEYQDYIDFTVDGIKALKPQLQNS
ncbi:MAG: tripartite tricarboxylate transporter substrate binding protein [Ruminococcaceae bacterium]|nr:tripartite tricarboxylate transporter substrate binding protein [Oscillospiraceae bacterium]